MKIATLLCVFIGLAPAVSAETDVHLGKDVIVHFASADESRQLLTTKDDYIRRLSPFDRSARMKVDRPIPEKEFLTFVGKNISEWTIDEIHKTQESLAQISALLSDRPLSFPATIQLIKTTGREEGNAAYTRGTAIAIPQGELSKNGKELQKLICHELFHVLSRQNPELRKKLYTVIGFTECDEVPFPPELASRKITNPDAPRNDHFIQVVDLGTGHPCFVLPILYSTAQTYDPKRGGEFFGYLRFQFLVLEKTTNPRQFNVVYENGSPKLLDPQNVSGFLEKIGRNTQYIIHPEEILADNFALLILGEQKVPSPEILQKMKEILFGS